MSALLAPVLSWVHTNPDALAVGAELTRRAPRVRGFGLLGTCCCLLVVLIAVIVILVVRRSQRRPPGPGPGPGSGSPPG